MKTILIIGSALKSFREFIQAEGHDYIMLRDVQTAKHPEKQLKRRVLCDFSSRETILQALDGIKQPIDAVMTTYENFILPGAIIAERLGVPGLPVAAAEACTDKELMRQLFAKAPEPISPAFQVVQREGDLKQFAANHDFPFILKPANLAKSLLVTKNHDLDELIANYKKAQEQIERVYKRYAPHRQPKLLVEEFLEGSIHSVDAFIDGAGEPHVLDQVVDYQTGYDIGYDDNFHYSRLLPSELSPELIAQVRHVASLGCKSLGIKNSPAHIEIILTKNGPRIVEIGARNGGYRERMHSLANGIDIAGTALKVALGEPFDIKAKREDPCAVLELFPKNPGAFSHISAHEELMTLRSLSYFSLKVEPGATVGKAADGYKMCAVIMLHNQDTAQFNKDLEFINQNVRVVTT